MPSRRIARIALAGIAVAAAVTSLAGFAAPQMVLDASATQPVDKKPAVDQKPKGKTVTIYLTRHGETMLNALGRVQGWSDSPLTEDGRAVAEHLGAGLAEAGVDFEAAYSADMVRHYETASLALGELGFRGDIVRDARLREIAFGKYEGGDGMEMWNDVAVELGYADAGELFSDPEFDMGAALEAMARLNEGSGFTAETQGEVAERALAALDEIAAKQSKRGGDVLVVSSGITIIATLDALGADLSEVVEGIENGAVSELQYRGGEWTVRTVNDLSYVEAGSD
ncbi:histidine phosphatase family protein [Agromyces sp. H3Y2-19a]|uniref:histidine phosphatase family protein n=1 Tax=Agromyces chromiiresistens TaxID=3030835 RepID=UPI0023B96A06|nr:histidine phosphatase family protein [Agromyces chromiiresistens]MDF0512464.1 histidine phosphatase family protein [Agromyces chromiiresistens]